jgi:HlyD family secretion protein
MTTRRYGVGRWWVLTLLSLAAIGVTGGSVLLFSKTLFANQSAPTDEGKSALKVNVEVISPRAGGIDRKCVQPCTLEAFDDATLYAKVSGYLAEQNVDRGSAVKKGDVLVRISVPEYEKQVKIDAAEVQLAEAKVDQMTAAIETANADMKAKTAAVALAKAEIKSKTAYLGYREKERNRITALAAKDAIDQKLVDEQEYQYQAASAAELVAGEAVKAAIEVEAAARSMILQAQANLKHARAEVEVAKARLEQSQVLLDYTVIRSPYTGVVTKRNFHVGDFIGSAGPVGNRVPLLAVERTDLMRMVVYVPDRDVPYVRNGNPAVVEFDALPGAPFITVVGKNKVEVSRSAESEDPHTRMMRVEVDLDNRDGKLRAGMFGRVSITLNQGGATSVRIPSIALVGNAQDGKASVRLVKDDTVHLIPVRYGLDNGTEVEILSGLTPIDRVVVRANGPLEEGTAVTIAQAELSGR